MLEDSREKLKNRENKSVSHIKCCPLHFFCIKVKSKQIHIYICLYETQG